MPRAASPAAILKPWTADPPLPEGVGDILDGFQCSGETAILWQCSARWRIDPRQVPDEMFFHVRRGRGTLHLPGRDVVLRPGVCAHIRRSERHSATNVSSDPLEVIAIHYQAAVGGVTLAHLLDLPDSFVIAPDSHLSAVTELACREFALREAGWHARLHALVTELLVLLVRSGAGSWLRAPPQLVEARRLLPAVNAMRAQLPQPLTIAALAQRCDLSVAQFRRVFHQVFACAPLEYLHRLRVAEAARLLRDEGLPVATVAARVGYADPAWFSHTFRRLTGSRPGQFARRSGP